MQEVTCARPLHDVWTREPRHVTEAVVAVDDGTVLDPGISYKELLIWRGTGGEGVSLMIHLMPSMSLCIYIHLSCQI